MVVRPIAQLSIYASVILLVAIAPRSALAQIVPGEAKLAVLDDNAHYYYYDQRVDLRLDRTRLAAYAAKTEKPGTPYPEPGFQPAIAPVQMVEWPIDDWSIAEAGRALSDRQLDELTTSLLRTHAFVAPVFFGLDGGVMFTTRQILVQFIDQIDRREAARIIRTLGPVAILDEHWGGLDNAYRLSLATPFGEEVLRVANLLARHPATIFAEPEMIFSGRPAFIPDDPGFVNLWGMRNLGQAGGVVGMDTKATYAWDLTTGEDTVQVMVIDVGVDQAHADLNVVAGADFTGQGGGGDPVNDCDNHGTAVAGCISAIINNSLGTVGMAPGCPTISARCLISLPACDGSWTSNSAWTVEALDWAQSRGVRVTNNSNEYGFMSGAIAQRYETARDAGIVHFASAGNGAARALAYPGSLPSVNAIGAIGRDGEKASFSNYHGNLAMVAPGRDIYTTDRSGTKGWSSTDYAFTFGTSFATPYASGVAALILSTNPSLSAESVEQILETTARDLGETGKDEYYGSGLVNAFKAVMDAQPCYPDCNADETLNIFDFLCYQNRFYQSNAYADCDTDGEVTFMDFVCFQTKFIEGCS